MAILVLGGIAFGGLKLGGVDLSQGFSFSMGSASADNGSAKYSGKILAVTVDAAQSWTLAQSSDCVTLNESMPEIKDGKASYVFTAASDGECTLTFTADDGKLLTADFSVANASIKSLRLN